MTACQNMHDRLLKGHLEKDVIEHIQHCAECSEYYASWQELCDGLNKWTTDQASSVTTPAQVQRFQKRVNTFCRTKQSKHLFLKFAVPAIALGACIFLLVTIQPSLFSNSTPSTVESLFANPPVNPQPKINIHKQTNGKIIHNSQTLSTELLTFPDGTLRIDYLGDTIALGADSRVSMNYDKASRLELELHKGQIAINARKRTKSETLSVLSRNTTVTVKGTHFMVDATQEDCVWVHVNHGIVAVSHNQSDEIDVKKGESLQISSHVPAIPIPIRENDATKLYTLLDMESHLHPIEPRDSNNRPPLETISKTIKIEDTKALKPQIALELSKTTYQTKHVKELIITGQYHQASTILNTHLLNSPTDASAWMLMATVNRKQKKWSLAVESYLYAANHGGPKASNRSKFEAAVILQDKLKKYARAEALYNEYVNSPKPIKPLERKALLRLVETQINIGNRSGAQSTASVLTETYPNSEESIRASQLIAH